MRKNVKPMTARFSISGQAMAVEPEMLRDTYERVWAIRGPLQDEIRNNRAAAKKKPIPPAYSENR
jgi:hypothetical protein